MLDPLMEAHKKALPDSRTRDGRGEVATPLGTATPVYCANCGKFAGYVFGSIEFMFYLCDDGCDVYGEGLEMPIVDPEALAAFNRGGT